VDDLRAELYRALKEHPLWDQRDWMLQVTDVTESGLVVLRALMSAADSASAWDLRCDMREHLVTYIRENHPDVLPRLRVAQVDRPPSGPSSPGDEGFPLAYRQRPPSTGHFQYPDGGGK
jgi:hypothetical protein